MSKFHSLTVAKVTRETRDAVALTFDVPAALKETFRFEQGQHLTLRAMIDGDDLRRSYSICSAVQDGDLRIAVKKSPGGAFSTWVNERVAPGQRIDVMPPMGHFNVALSASHRNQYVGFAAGSGITPLLSIVKTTLLAEPHSRFTLFYGNRSSSAVIFREALADLKDRFLERFSLIYVMSREPQDIELLNGRINRAKADALIDALAGYQRHRNRFRLRSRWHDARGRRIAAGTRSGKIENQDRALRREHPQAPAAGARCSRFG